MELVIDEYSNIIDENFKDFCTIEKTMDEQTIDEFLGICKDEVSRNILVEFGLSQFYDNFKDGGNVATIHNAEKSIFPNEEIEMRYKQSYKDAERHYRDKIPDTRKESFKKKDEIKSYLTGENLPKDGRMHMDHVKSAKKIHDMDEARLYMTDEERGAMAQDERNLKPLEQRLNQSKNDKDMAEWLDKERSNGQTNEEYFSIDREKALREYEKSNRFINRTVNFKKYSTIGAEGARQGLIMGEKQVIGLILFEFTNGFFELSKSIFQQWNYKKTLEEKIGLFEETIIEAINITIIKFNNIKDNVVQTFIIGLSSGFMANLITFIINQFATTMKAMTKMINDSIYAIIRAFKLVVTRPNGISSRDAIREAIKIVTAAILASGGVMLTQTFILFLKTTPLAPFADTVGGVLGATLTGLITALSIYTIDNFRNIIHDIGANLANTIQYAQISAAEIESSFLNTLSQIDELYKDILANMYKEYKEMASLREMAYDFNMLSCERFNASIKYAEFLGVNEEKTIKSDKDLEDFLFN